MCQPSGGKSGDQCELSQFVKIPPRVCSRRWPTAPRHHRAATPSGISPSGRGDRGSGRLGLRVRPLATKTVAEFYAISFRGGKRCMAKLGAMVIWEAYLDRAISGEAELGDNVVQLRPEGAAA